MNQAIKNFRKELACTDNCMCFDCILTHVANGCNYGLPDGQDDTNKDCECGE